MAVRLGCHHTSIPLEATGAVCKHGTIGKAAHISCLSPTEVGDKQEICAACMPPCCCLTLDEQGWIYTTGTQNVSLFTPLFRSLI
ncbi:MAG: hypothetical protein SPJ13_00640 [Bacteroidales bacterium]|nr:hypothetical protein [Bacteroidales bacterium]